MSGVSRASVRIGITIKALAGFLGIVLGLALRLKHERGLVEVFKIGLSRRGFIRAGYCPLGVCFPIQTST